MKDLKVDYLLNIISRYEIKVRDYLNDEINKETLPYVFDLIQCNNCGKYELEDDLIKQENDFICEKCSKELYDKDID